MAFPTGGNKLQTAARQDSDGTLVETYTIPGSPYQHQLGTGSIPSFPVLPTGWQLLVKGAFPLPAPAAPTSIGTVSGAGNFLTPSTLYKWVVTHETDYGETVAGAILSVTIGAGSGGAGYHMTLPALNGTASNPVRRRRLWRTVSGGAGSFFLVDEFGVERTDYLDWRADSMLETSTTAPVINTSGATAITSLKINGVEKVTNEVVSAPGVAGAWSCDYTYGPSGGLITHAAADTGLTVIATYTAAVELNSQLFNDLITAIKEIDTAWGANSGFADLDSGGHVPLARLSGLTTSQLSGTAGITNAQIAAVDGSKITSGTIPVARLVGLTSTNMQAGGTNGFGGASGFASLDGSSHVVQAGAVNPVTAGVASGIAAHDNRGMITAATGTTAPSVANGTNMPAGGSVSLGANADNRAGSVVITIGAAPTGAQAQLVVVTFGGGALSRAPRAVLVSQMDNLSVQSMIPYTGSVTATSFAIYTTPTWSAGTIKISYIVEL